MPRIGPTRARGQCGELRTRRLAPPNPLPLRWAVIIAIAAAAGIMVGLRMHPAAGIVSAIALAGVLHRIIGR
jgi:hypothetical protein